MSNDPVVMFDSPEAARKTTVEGWVSRDGFFFGSDERTARYSGCTHRACEDCGAPVEKFRLVCAGCTKKRDDKRYAAMPRKAWDGAMVYSELLDKYYSNPDEAEDNLEEEQTLEDLRLVICEPSFPREIDEDFFCDDMAEGGELPDVLVEAMERFNAVIKHSPPLSWSPGGYALELNAKEKA